MNPHLTYMIAQARNAELQRAAQRSQLIRDAHSASAAQQSVHEERVTGAVPAAGPGGLACAPWPGARRSPADTPYPKPSRS